MSRWNRVVLACAASLLVAACGDSRSLPTAPEVEARRTGGYSVGANDMPSDSTTTTTSVQTLSGDSLVVEEGEGRSGGYSVGAN